MFTPFGFGAPSQSGAGAQLATALMAQQRLQQQKARLGIPTYGSPAAQPGAVIPGQIPNG